MRTILHSLDEKALHYIGRNSAIFVAVDQMQNIIPFLSSENITEAYGRRHRQSEDVQWEKSSLEK